MSQSDQPYPRPDFVRSNLNWQSLNGPWDLLFDDKDIGLSNRWHQTGLPQNDQSDQKPASSSQQWQPVSLSKPAKPNKRRTIQVPFVFQCEASGINDKGVHEVLWYERRIKDIRSKTDNDSNQRLLLRFGAVDYIATVWLEGQYVGSHQGGHVPFDLDLTDAISFVSNSASNPPSSSSSDKEYRLTIRVFDSAKDTSQPRGKQFWGPKPQAIWYTPSSGIWQNVWLESVPRLRIADSRNGTILRSHDVENADLDARIAVQGRRAGEFCSMVMFVSLDGVEVGWSMKRPFPDDEEFIRFNHGMRWMSGPMDQRPKDSSQHVDHNGVCWQGGVALWSPEHPTLYDVTIVLMNEFGVTIDEVKTTVGMRSLDWTSQPGHFLLNGKPYFQSLLLDQGYWPRTLMTPPTQQSLKNDILLSKSLGFNGCRKHQKVEDPAFLYWADKLGFLVWGEMASCHRFSNDAAERFEEEWMEAVKRDINHPCIVTWMLANESWGYAQVAEESVAGVRQRDALRSLYYRTKALDWTRPINDNCGWEHVVTDLYTFHEYENAEGMERRCGTLEGVYGMDRNRKVMFVPPLDAPNGLKDAGCEPKPGVPILCTEFGGVNIAVEKDPEQKTNWGYITAGDPEELLKIVDGIVMATVKSGLVCGVVWTQL